MHELAGWLRDMADSADRLCAIGALEGAAGNISLFLPPETAGLTALLSTEWPAVREFTLPGTAPLPAGVLLITGTGRRLRDIAAAPAAVLCALAINETGSALLHRAPGHDVEPTSEIDSHLGIHAAVLGTHATPHAVVHAQPPRLTYLSHVPAYQDEPRLNRQLLRWQPETIVTLPEGLGLLPFVTPGTAHQGQETATAMRRRRFVIWARHGVVARSLAGPSAATDLIDYAETAAGYEVMDLQCGRAAAGLSLDELRAIASRFGVPATLLDTLPADLLR